MASKYHGLPDIDTAADVFETADEPESLLKPTESEGEERPSKPVVISEALDQSGLPDRRKAGRIFGRNTKKTPRLPRLPRYSSEDDSSSDEPSLPLESTTARLRRLKAELADLEASITSTSSNSGPSSSRLPDDKQLNGNIKRKSVLPPRPAVNLVEELSELKGRLERLDGVSGEELGPVASGSGSGWSERLERLQVTELDIDQPQKGEGVASQGLGTDQQRSKDPTRPLTDLDARLAALEGAMGQVDTQTPLLPTVDRLDHILTLLTQPRHLDAISRKIKLLLVDLDRAAAAAKRAPHPSTGLSLGLNTPNPNDKDKPSTITLSQAEYTQLSSLFSLLPRLDPLLPIVPPLLNRLQSLSGLHAEAADVIDGLRKLQSDEGDSAEELKDLQRLAATVQEGLTESAKGIERNWHGVEGRLNSLEERLKRL